MFCVWRRFFWGGVMTNILKLGDLRPQNRFEEADFRLLFQPHFLKPNMLDFGGGTMIPVFIIGLYQLQAPRGSHIDNRRMLPFEGNYHHRSENVEVLLLDIGCKEQKKDHMLHVFVRWILYFNIFYVLCDLCGIFYTHILVWENKTSISNKPVLSFGRFSNAGFLLCPYLNPHLRRIYLDYWSLL